MYKVLIMVFSPGQESNEGKIFPCREGESMERASACGVAGKQGCRDGDDGGKTGAWITDA
jgi:hypothetical protein